MMLPSWVVPHACGQTDRGRVRANNEDAYLIAPRRGLYVVADGMGGHRAGEVASRETVACLDGYFTKDRLRGLRLGAQPIREELIDAVRQAHARIKALSSERDAVRGMGCTLVVALVLRDVLHLAHVGDARAYLIRPREIALATIDHTPAGMMISNGLLTPAQARLSPLKHQLMQAVGVGETITPGYREVRLQPTDRVLLCSDGVWGMLSDVYIWRAVAHNRQPARACRQLVRWANQVGGRDNITAVVFSQDARAWRREWA
jgi:PPM family protein phosphatase